MDLRKIESMSFDGMLELFPYGFKFNNLGGHQRCAKPLHFNDSEKAIAHLGKKPIVKGENYHVETSYSEEQLPYVRRAITLLDGIVQGKIAETVISGDNSQQQIKSLSERVVEIFPNSRVFGYSLKEGIVSIIEQFGELYPNFIPALYNVMVSNVGSGGTRAAIERSSRFLPDALDGLLNRQNIEEFGNVGIRELVRVHPIIASVVEYEIHCPGMVLAYHIMRETKIAALELAEKINDLNSHIIYTSHYLDSSSLNPASDAILVIRAAVDQLMRDAMKKFCIKM